MPAKSQTKIPLCPYCGKKCVERSKANVCDVWCLTRGCQRYGVTAPTQADAHKWHRMICKERGKRAFMTVPKGKTEPAMQVRCLKCLREQYGPIVYAVSHGTAPCAWCGEWSEPMTEKKYMKLLTEARDGKKKA